MRQVSSFKINEDIFIWIGHEVLVDKPDVIKSIKEADINEDDHHNVETTKNNSEGDSDDDYDIEDDYSST